MNLRTWRKDELEIIWLCEGGEPKNVTEWVAYGKGWTFVEFNCRNGACSGTCNAACNDLGLGWWNYQHGDGDQSWVMSEERKELYLQCVWISLLITGSLDGCLVYLVLGAFRAEKSPHLWHGSGKPLVLWLAWLYCTWFVRSLVFFSMIWYDSHPTPAHFVWRGWNHHLLQFLQETGPFCLLFLSHQVYNLYIFSPNYRTQLGYPWNPQKLPPPEERERSEGPLQGKEGRVATGALILAASLTKIKTGIGIFSSDSIRSVWQSQCYKSMGISGS